MALVNRVSRLFKADFHAVLDRIEEPDVLLRQAIREMQEDIAEDERRLKLLQVEQQQGEQRVSRLQQSLEQIEEELDVCFDAGKQDLTRQVIRRKLEQQQRLGQIMQQQRDRQQYIADVQQRLSDHRQQLASMQEKAECLLDASSVEEDRYDSIEIGIQERDVEVAFLKEQQRRAS